MRAPEERAVVSGKTAAVAGVGLANEKFVAKAPADVVESERRKLGEWSARREQLRDKVQTLCGAREAGGGKR